MARVGGGMVVASLILLGKLFLLVNQELPDSIGISSLNLMDQNSLPYAYKDGAGDVERTLKMVETGVVGSHTTMTEVSLKSISQVCGLFVLNIGLFINMSLPFHSLKFAFCSGIRYLV